MSEGDCTGNEIEHCCWVDGKPCPFLVTNVAGRKWACGLRIQLGSWEAVHTDPRYLRTVRPVWDKYNVADCGDWPRKNELCGTCGIRGS